MHSPKPAPTYCHGVHHPSAVLIQLFIINSYFQAIPFRNPGYGSAPQTPVMTQARHIGQGQEGRHRASSCGVGTCEAGCAAEPGHGAMTQVSPHAAWCRLLSHMCMSVCASLQSRVQNKFLRQSMVQCSWGVHLYYQIQLFILRCAGVGGTAGKHKTSGHI